MPEPSVAASSNAVLSAKDLVVHHGARPTLDGATVAINEGERVGLVGRNGTGKSTFLRLAAGVAEPDGGEVTRRRELVAGFLPQDFALDGERTRPGKRPRRRAGRPRPDRRVRAPARRERPRRGTARPHRPARRLEPRRARGRTPAPRRRPGRRPPGRGPVGRGKASRGPRPRAPAAAGPLDLRRADQPPGHRDHRVAGGLPGPLWRDVPVRHPRPLFPGPGGHAHPRTGQRPVLLPRRQLHLVPGRKG